MIHQGNDQAAGLRRMLEAGPRRIVTIVSSASVEALGELMLNLGSALTACGREVLIIDADRRAGRVSMALGVDPGQTLLDAASGICSVDDAIRTSPHGFEVAMLLPRAGAVAPGRIARLEGALRRAGDRADVTLVGMSLRCDQGWSLPALARGEIVVQMGTTRSAVTGGYRLIKHLTTRLGRRPFDILVTDATPEQAHIAAGNVVRAAERYLAVPVTPVGAIPADDHVNRAASLGRSVIEVYPRSSAAVAYRRFASALTQPPRSRVAVPAARTAAPSVNAEFGY